MFFYNKKSLFFFINFIHDTRPVYTYLCAASTSLCQWCSKCGITYCELSCGFRLHRSERSSGFRYPRTTKSVNHQNVSLDTNDASSSGERFCSSIQSECHMTHTVSDNVSCGLLTTSCAISEKTGGLSVIQVRTICTNARAKKMTHEAIK